MHDFYIDDTERGNRNKEGYLPILGGFTIGKDKYNQLQEVMRRLKQSAGLDKNDPIKWSPGQNDILYANQRSIPNQNDFKETVLKMIGSQDLKIIISIIDTQNLYPTWTYESYRKMALEYLSQRFQHYLMENGVTEINSGQVIIDYPGNSIESSMSRHYHTICCKGCSYIPMKLSLLSNTLYLAHAFSNEGLQIADFIVGSIGYTLKTKCSNYFDLIKSNIRSKDGNMKGTGVIIFPSNSRIADHLFK